MTVTFAAVAANYIRFAVNRAKPTSATTVRLYECRAYAMQTTYATSGTYTSSTIDLGGVADAATLTLLGTLPTGTSVAAKLAGSANGTTWTSYLGPDGTTGTSFTTLGSALVIPAVLQGYRYLRFQLTLSTTNTAVTPALSSVQIGYSVRPATDTVAPTLSVTTPADGAVISYLPVPITGTASDAGGMLKVLVSTDGGNTWVAATTSDGWATWSQNWYYGGSGVYTLMVRAIDRSMNATTVTRSVTVNVD
jgi:hypothetical protein